MSMYLLSVAPGAFGAVFLPSQRAVGSENWMQTQNHREKTQYVNR